MDWSIQRSMHKWPKLKERTYLQITGTMGTACPNLSNTSDIHNCRSQKPCGHSVGPGYIVSWELLQSSMSTARSNDKQYVCIITFRHDSDIIQKCPCFYSRPNNQVFLSHIYGSDRIYPIFSVYLTKVCWQYSLYCSLSRA